MEHCKISFRKRKAYADVDIYYSVNGEELRHKTGVKVDLKHLTKDGKGITQKHPNYEIDIDTIKREKELVETIIDIYLKKYKEKPSIKHVLEEIDKPIIQEKRTFETFIDYLDEMVEEKVKNEWSEEKSKQPYTNLKDAFLKFSTKHRVKLTFDNLDQDFFRNFIHFLMYEKNWDNNDTTKIGLSNNTIIKRLESFTTFLRWCAVERDIVLNIDKIKSFIKKSKSKLDVKETDDTEKKISLTLEELTAFFNYDINDIYQTLDYPEFNRKEYQYESMNRFKKIFIFSCLQGLRISDLNTFSKFNVNGDYILKDSMKLNDEFKLELHPISRLVLEENDYNLKTVEQHYRKGLKFIFEGFYKYYKPIFEKEHKKPFPLYTRISRKIGAKRDYTEVGIWQLISSHTGRRTFVNLLINIDSLSLGDIMQRGGWKKIETVNKYLDKKHNKTKDFTKFIKLD